MIHALLWEVLFLLRLTELDNLFVPLLEHLIVVIESVGPVLCEQIVGAAAEDQIEKPTEDDFASGDHGVPCVVPFADQSTPEHNSCPTNDYHRCDIGLERGPPDEQGEGPGSLAEKSAADPEEGRRTPNVLRALVDNEPSVLVLALGSINSLICGRSW